MKTIFKVINKSGNDVTEFDTKLEAEQYIQSNSDKELSIKEKKTWTLYEWITFGISFLMYKGFGVSGVLSVFVGYFLFEHLKKKNNIYLSGLLGLLVGVVTLILSYYVMTQILFPELTQ